MSVYYGERTEVYCHVCAQANIADWNEETQEYECGICRGTFVEALNQGLETFMQPDPNNSTLEEVPSRNESQNNSNHTNEPSEEEQQSTAEGPPSVLDHDQIVQQVLNRIFGVETEFTSSTITGSSSSTSSTQPSIFLQTGRDSTPRPMGIIIRNPSNQEMVAPRGSIFSLLQSVAAIRSSNNNPTGGIQVINGNTYSSGGALDNQAFEHFLHHLLMNETSHSGAPPASQDIILTLPRKHLAVEDNEEMIRLGECSITQEAFEVGDVVVSLPCGHHYKEEPITHWLQMHCTCPVCRINIANSSTAANTT